MGCFVQGVKNGMGCLSRDVLSGSLSHIARSPRLFMRPPILIDLGTSTCNRIETGSVFTLLTGCAYKTYVVCTQKTRLNETALLTTQNTHSY